MTRRSLKDTLTRCEVLETQEGKTRDFCDILIAGGKDGKDIWLKGVPFFDESGREVGYDEALELYGEAGLSDGIWDTESYRAYITAHAYKSLWQELLEELEAYEEDEDALTDTASDYWGWYGIDRREAVIDFAIEQLNIKI